MYKSEELYSLITQNNTNNDDDKSDNSVVLTSREITQVNNNILTSFLCLAKVY